MLSFRLMALPALLLAAATTPAVTSRAAAPSITGRSPGSLPLLFEPNAGQAPDGVLYRARGAGYGLSITDRGAVLKLAGADGASEEVRLWLRGARGATPAGELRSRSVANYLTGKDRSKWKLGVPQYSRVRIPGEGDLADLVFYGREGEIEFDLVLDPGQDPKSQILRISGGRLSVDAGGGLRVALTQGALRLAPPVAFQETKSGRRDVECTFWVTAPGQVGFQVGEFDRELPLVIDPILQYATYLGGRGIDQIRSVAADSAGNTYVAGYTESTDFPTAAPGQPISGGSGDAFVTKLSADGSAPLFSTYLGGSGQDIGTGVAVTDAGDVYVSGSTNSPDFPVAAALQGVLAGGRDAFLARLSPSGSELVFSTLLGGDNDDLANGVALDATGSAYLCGVTDSANFPVTAGAAREVFSGQFDAFAVRISSDGLALIYSTYIGGRNGDVANAVAADSTGAAVVVGGTASAPGNLEGDPLGFPIVDSGVQVLFQGGSEGDGFAVRLSPDGSRFEYATYLGGSGSDACTGVAVDPDGSAYVVGVTDSDDLLADVETRSTALQGAFGGGVSDGFLVKLSRTGSGAGFVTYIGGSGRDTVAGVALGRDIIPQVYVTGSTNSEDFPLLQSIQSRLAGESDAFVMKIQDQQEGDTGRLVLTYSTLFGGSSLDEAAGLAVDGNGNVAAGGTTFSRDLPLFRPFQDARKKRGVDGFVFKLSDGVPQPGGVLAIQSRVKFGRTNAGKTKQRKLVIRNLSETQDLAIELGTPSEPFGLASGATSFNLRPGQKIRLTVLFTPTGTGPFEGVLPVRTSDPTLPLVNVTLLGRGQARQTEPQP